MVSSAIPQHPEGCGEWSCAWAGRECSSHGLCFFTQILEFNIPGCVQPPPANPGRQRRGWRGTNRRSDRPELSLVGQHQELVLNFDLKVKKKLC